MFDVLKDLFVAPVYFFMFFCFKNPVKLEVKETMSAVSQRLTTVTAYNRPHEMPFSS